MDDHLGRVYDSMASMFEQHAADGAYNAHYDRPALLDLLGDVHGMRVLDAGCGPGFYSALLVERGAQVVAIDASEPMVELARARLGDRCVVQQQMLGAPMPFDDASFDAVVCALTIHHVDDRASDITYWDTSDGAYLWTGPSPVAAGVIPNPTLSRHGTYMSTLTNSPEGVRISVETLDGVAIVTSPFIIVPPPSTSNYAQWIGDGSMIVCQADGGNPGVYRWDLFSAPTLLYRGSCPATAA